MELTYHEIKDTLDTNRKNNAALSTEYTLPQGIYENSNINLMLKSLLPNEVKVIISIDDRLITKLTTEKTIKFTEKPFFKTTLPYTQSHSGPVNDPPEGKIQKIPEIYESEKPINISGIDKTHLKCNCIDGSTVIDVREPILHSFGLDKLPAQK